MAPKAVEEKTEDALVRPAVWVSEQHVHITTGCLPPSVRTTCHTQQPGVESLSCFPDLGKSGGQQGGPVGLKPCKEFLSQGGTRDFPDPGAHMSS